MLPLHQVEAFLQKSPLQLSEIVLELRNIVFSTAPDAVEVIRWRGLNYFHAGRGGIVSAGICQIGIFNDHVRLGFIHGAFLEDPKHLLCGCEKYKRFIEIRSFMDADWDYYRRMIEASGSIDPYHLPPVE